MGDDSRERGYVFDYDALNRLTLARYGEHADISTNPNRYTEKVGLYSTNSMIRRFQRHGLKANGVYGKIDNLHVSLDGNRIKSVLEDAPAVTTPGSMDFAGVTGKESTMTYDAAGNMITDSSRGISLISYDNSNRPISILFEDGNETRYVYSAAGEKLRTVHLTAVEGVMSAATDGIAPLAEARIIALDTTDYRGSVVYRNGRPDMLLFDGGYVTFDGGVTYHYYTRDYLGSNRAVTNGTTGQVEQTVAYYPFGGVIADLGTGANMQPYKFSGKELDRTHGLNKYDFSARRYLQSVPTFTQPDELSSDYPWLSPYCYCAGNPVNLIDPTGQRIVYVEDEEEWEYKCLNGTYGFYNSQGEIYTKENPMLEALTEIRTDPLGEQVIDALIDTDKNIVLNYTNDERPENEMVYSSVEDYNIYWDPDNWNGGIAYDKDGNPNRVRSPISGLAHELGHSYDYLLPREGVRSRLIQRHLNMNEYEVIPCIIENAIRKRLGDPIRQSYEIITNPYNGNIKVDDKTKINYTHLDYVILTGISNIK